MIVVAELGMAITSCAFCIGPIPTQFLSLSCYLYPLCTSSNLQFLFYSESRRGGSLSSQYLTLFCCPNRHVFAGLDGPPWRATMDRGQKNSKGHHRKSGDHSKTHQRSRNSRKLSRQSLDLPSKDVRKRSHVQKNGSNAFPSEVALSGDDNYVRDWLARTNLESVAKSVEVKGAEAKRGQFS